MNTLPGYFGNRKACLLVLCAMLAASFPARAQGTYDAVDPGRLFRQLRKEQQVPLGPGGESGARDVRGQSLPAARAPEGADKIRMLLRDLVIEGEITAYQKDAFRPMYADKIGRKVSLKDIYDIGDAITRKYHGDGYVLSRALVPEQEIDPAGGAVRIHVTEGYIRNVTLPEDELGRKLSRDLADSIKAMRPFRMDELERRILFFNRMGAVTLQAVFKPVQDARAPEGAVDLELLFSRRDFGGIVSLDNHGSKYHGPHQMVVMADIGNFGVPYSKITVMGVTSVPTNELNLGAMEYQVPLSAGGLALTAGFGYTNSVPGKELREFEIESDTYHGNMGLSYPFLLSRREKLTGSVRLGFSDTRMETLGALFSKDRIRALRIGGSYEYSDAFGGTSKVEAVYSHGLDILGAIKSGSATLTRAAGQSDFQKAEITAARLQALPHGYQVAAYFSGQYSLDPLLSSEEFGFGGQSMGRGYDVSEIVGDHGMGALVEFRHGDAKSLAENLSYLPYVFYDIGKVWNIDPGNKYTESAASAGGGVRLQYEDRLSGEASVAVPLTHDADTRAYGARRDPRYFLKLTTRL